MKTFHASLANKPFFLSIIVATFFAVPEANAFTGFGSEPIEEIIVTAQRPPVRDDMFNQFLREQADMAYMAELQRLLSETQAQIIEINEEIAQKEEEVEERCRTVRNLVEEGTAACEDVAQALNYVCLGGAIVLAELSSGVAGGVAALACTAGYDDSISRCNANPGGGISDTLGSQIDEYCPDAR